MKYSPFSRWLWNRTEILLPYCEGLSNPQPHAKQISHLDFPSPGIDNSSSLLRDLLLSIIWYLILFWVRDFKASPPFVCVCVCVCVKLSFLLIDLSLIWVYNLHVALFIKTYNMCTPLLSVCTRLILGETFQSQIWYSAEAAGDPDGQLLIISIESLGEAWIFHMPSPSLQQGLRVQGKKWERKTERERQTHTYSAPLLFSFSYQ